MGTNDKQCYFVAGTDTEIGKTWACEQLLKATVASGRRAFGLKPIAAGAERNLRGTLENEDALRLMRASNVTLTYDMVNPFCLPYPVSPHLAADKSGQELDPEHIALSLRPALERSFDLCLIEGAGGWKAPISLTHTMADIAIALGVPVILVVGMRLGCLNHALLTVNAIQADGLKLAGWVANQVQEDMSCYTENVHTLKTLIDAPLIAELPYDASPNHDSKCLKQDINRMFDMAVE